MDIGSIAQHREALLRAMPEVGSHIASFRSINKRWDGAITAGMIEAGRMEEGAARLFGPLIQDMSSTKVKYSEMQGRLVDAILFEMAKKSVLELTDAAKFTINILKRNLYERTADVGYLATDAELVDFLRLARDDDTGLAAERAQYIRARLAAYQAEYTVYDEILVLDREGRVRANLDPGNPARRSVDPLLAQALAVDLHDGSGDKYVEVFRPTDLRPDRGNTLVYAQKIEDPRDRTPLGVLCLCFDFAAEMEGIYKDLRQGNGRLVVAILDEAGRVLSSNDPRALPLEASVPVDLEADFRFLSLGNTAYLACTVSTDGYQGFYGLTWYGLAMVHADAAFVADPANRELDERLSHRLRNVSGELSAIKNESDDLLADMKLDSINGQVKAAKFKAGGFVEVLRFVDWTGDEIGRLFSQAIARLQQTVVASLLGEVQFRAFQGNNIADRNLYERANDVCWWALTPRFRELLTRRAGAGLTGEDRAELTASLQYINDLYTPYLRLVLADVQGVVVAVSDPPEGLAERLAQEGLPRGQELVDMRLDSDLMRRALALESGGDYCVSAFAPTPLYGGRPTYVYSTAVRDPQDESRPVGVIQIVFDAEPQFAAMLQDILPRDARKRIVEGSFAVFAGRDRGVISSTSPAHPAGGRLPLDEAFFQYGNGERASAVVELDGRAYAMGLQISHGYREYKRQDEYVNDMVCLVFVPV